MGCGNKSGFELGRNLEIETASASLSPGTHHNSPEVAGNVEHQSPPLVFETNLPRASDLLISVSVRASVNKPKITNLAMAAVDEITQLALEQEALWLFDIDTGDYVLNNVEYKRRFGPLDPALEEILTMLKTEGPIQLPKMNDTLEVSLIELRSNFLHTEASRENGLVYMNPLNLVEMFMNVDQWSAVFSSIVSKAKLIEVLSTGEQGKLDGALLVMTAEFHVSSPLVQTRESYFARHCRQLSLDTWVVVDVSLESIFPNPETRFLRRPSGCFIKSIGSGYSKVTWIEHSEADKTLAHPLFRPLLTSGSAFCAKRWIETLACQCDRVATYRDDRVKIMQDGRRSLLKLADRMMRNYYAGVSASAENKWKPIPVAGAEDILVTTKYNNDDPETPHGVLVTVATTIWLPAQPKNVFDFLRDGDHRNQWDFLSLNCRTREMARVTTGRSLANCMSIIAIDASPLIFYLQESHTNSMGSYVIYAPIDLFAVNSVLGGANPDDIQILSSGFAVLPDRWPLVHGEEIGGTLLTIAFQVIDEYASSPEYLPPISVATLYTIITETASMIRAAVVQ